MSLPLPPLTLVLEFTRVQQADDPYGFQFLPQDYLLRTHGGGVERGSLSWDAALLADLEAVRRPGSDPALRQRLGEALRRFLMPLGWAELSIKILEAARQGRRVHLTFRSAAAELYALPWELLTLKASGQHIGELRELLLRYEWPETTTAPEQPTPRPGSGRLLLAWSAAGGAVPAAEHAQAMVAACRAASVDFDPHHEVLTHTSLGQLRAALSRAKEDNRPISVLHLLAHGGVAGSTFGLVLDGESPADGAAVVDAGQLRQLLAPYAEMVRLVLLVACDSGNVGALGNQLGSVAQTLHRAGIAAVVASRYPLSAAGSSRLVETIYSGLLAAGVSLETALLRAREALAHDADHKDWASLQLYARAADGDDSRPIVFRPYQGLASFQLEHTRYFFGREALTKRLWQRCRDLFSPLSPVRLLAILGPSGSGKSSVARAGLVAELLQSPLADLQPLRVVVLRPGEHPQRELQHALSELPQVAPEPALLLLVDQFEEVYTHCSDEEERAAFVRWLLQAASDGSRRIAVVLTLRSDFFGETQRHHGELNQLIAAQHELVPGLTPTELRQIIAEPARAAGRPIDADTVELLLAEARGSEGALPLLEFALTRIWEKMLAGQEPGSTLREVGGVGGALADQARKLYGALNPREQATARRALMRLVKLGEGTRDTRRRAAVSELCGRGESEADVLAVLRKFAAENARIVTLAGTGVEAVAEVTHEALFEHWLELRAWIDQGRADRRFHDRIAEAARLWSEDRSRSGRLWRPPDLDLLRTYRARNPDDLSTLDEAFFSASEQAQQVELEENRRRTRMLRFGLALVSCLLLIAVAFAEYAISEQRVAKVERDHAKAALDRAEQRELDMVVENGRQLLVEKNRAVEALVWLHRAKERASRSPILPYLLRETAQPLDAVYLVLRGHSSRVTGASHSPDASRIITSSSDNSVRIWDSYSGQLLTTLPGQLSAVLSASYSPDASSIVLASHDKVVRILDAHSGQLLTNLEGHLSYATGARYSPDGSRIVTGSWDTMARVWDARSGQLLATLRGHSSIVTSASFSPDAFRVVTSSADKTARVWDAQNGRLLITLEGHWSHVTSASYSPDASRIVTTSEDKTARLWDARSGQLLIILKGHEATVTSASYSPDASHIVTASADSTARVWDAHSGQLQATLQGHAAAVTSASYSPDASRIVTASADNTARVWDAYSGQPLTTLQQHLSTVTSASYSPDSSRIVTASEDRTARVWNAHSGQPLTTLQGHAATVTSASYSPDASRIVTASEDSTARIWDAHSGQLLTTLKGHEAPVTSASYSPDARCIITTSEDNTARVWDVPSGRPLITLQGHSGTILSSSYSPDTNRIVTASEDNTARIWDAHSGQLLITLQGHPSAVTSANYSPDSTRIVTACEDSIARVWDARSGQLLITLQGHSASVTSASYSPDARRIVTASRDKTAQVWDARNGQLLTTLQGHSAALTSAGYSPDSRYIVTASKDHTARVWDVAAEARSTAELQKLISCLAEKKLVGDALVPAQLDLQACKHLPLHTPRPLTWDQQSALFAAGVYALQAGQRAGAKLTLLEARRCIELFQEPEYLAKLTLVEASLSRSEQDSAPTVVADLVRRAPPSEQTRLWQELAGLASRSLHRLHWAISLLEEQQKSLPSGSRIVASISSQSLAFRLSAGDFADVLQQAPSVIAMQTEQPSRVVVAALAWAAALQQTARAEQRSWAKRAFGLYSELPEDASLRWTFDSSRYALLKQPDSAARKATLELFDLLEQKKSLTTTAKFAKLLGVQPRR